MWDKTHVPFTEIESELIYVPEASACRQTISLQPADRSINNVATQRLEHWRQPPSTVRVAECGSVCTSISTICSCLYVHCQQKALYVAPPVAICLGHLADETSYTMSAQVKPKETAYQPFQALGKGTKRGCSVAVVVYTSRFATPVASHVFTKIATARFFSSKRGAMLTAPLSNTSLYCYVQLYALFFFHNPSCQINLRAHSWPLVQQVSYRSTLFFQKSTTSAIRES